LKKFLITGAPGVGKTTLVERLCDDLAPYGAVGFYTAEIREEGTRRGFELIGLDGRKGVLAHVKTPGGPHVGKYGVDVSGFEEFLRSIPFAARRASPVIIDEIGKMECFSKKFEALIDALMREDRVVVATVAWKGEGLISRVKKTRGAVLYEITRANRDGVYAEIRDAVLEALRD
jgi:nucleoside-triphosphatase